MIIDDNGACCLCPRKCGINRKEGKKGYCGAGAGILVARAAPHMWEEPCISGKNGSGAVFFAGCNLHCVYCQNKAISDGNGGKIVSIQRLSEIFLELQEKKVYNINLVTPTHYALQIREAILKAREQGLNIPIVYNCGGYESTETVKALSDCVDIWMPDLKYISNETAARYSNCPDYFENAVAALDEMTAAVKSKGGTAFAGQDGDKSENTADGIMLKGVIVRHMLLPGRIGESKRILRFLHDRYGNDIYISIMSQYTPMPQILKDDRFKELQSGTDMKEYERLVDFAINIGIENAFIQEGETAGESFIPTFDGEGV